MSHDTPQSPLAPAQFLDPKPIDGARFSTAEAGIKYRGRTDVLLALFDEGTTVAGVFTQSKCPSAPVELCRTNLPNGKARALLVNSGNANAFTGLSGKRSVQASLQTVSRAAQVPEAHVYLASTGVIGEPLDPSAFDQVMAGLVANNGSAGFLDAARAIMTTDTFPKTAEVKLTLDGQTVRIAGIAKGAGMIAPNMATMLSFIVTDAPVSSTALQAMLSRTVKTTFNAVTVDSDTSTSDTVLVFATGKAAERGVAPVLETADRRYRTVSRALKRLMTDLAQQIARDGEGARKFVSVTVSGATSIKAAKAIAASIANSPLVKTAIAGEDANWGRVVMAVGKAGQPADRDRLAIRFGQHVVAERGERAPDYSEDTVASYMRNPEIEIGVDLGLGTAKFTMWTCDLTKNYVAINGDYRS